MELKKKRKQIKNIKKYEQPGTRDVSNLNKDLLPPWRQEVQKSFVVIQNDILEYQGDITEVFAEVSRISGQKSCLDMGGANSKAYFTHWGTLAVWSQS